MSEELRKKMSEAHKGRIPWNKGIPRSLEVKKKISDKHKGRSHSPATQFKKGLVPWNKGKEFLSLEIRKRIGVAHRKEKIKKFCLICKKEFNVYPCVKEKARFCSQNCFHSSLFGEKSPNWKGGITPENLKIRNSLEYTIWRESIFSRDGWKCQKCETKEGFLHAHHIRNFSEWKELRFVESNGITLCKGCHNLFHKTFGRHHNNEEQMAEFLKQETMVPVSLVLPEPQPCSPC